MNENSTNEEVLPTGKEAIEIVKDFGYAGCCVRSAVNETFENAVSDGVEASISDYMDNYEFC